MLIINSKFGTSQPSNILMVFWLIIKFSCQTSKCQELVESSKLSTPDKNPSTGEKN